MNGLGLGSKYLELCIAIFLNSIHNQCNYKPTRVKYIPRPVWTECRDAHLLQVVRWRACHLPSNIKTVMIIHSSWKGELALLLYELTSFFTLIIFMVDETTVSSLHLYKPRFSIAKKGSLHEYTQELCLWYSQHPFLG